MASGLNIGGINFGVDAQTQGLQKAITQLQAFQRVVNQTARSQAQGAQTAANALGRQESAIKRAFQQTLNLQRSLRAASAPPEHVARVSNAFRTLTKEMTSGQLSAIQFSRAMDAFNARINRSARALKDMQAAARRGEVSRLTELFRELESSAVLAVGPLSGLGARLRSLGAIASRTNLSIAALVATAVGVVVGFGKLAFSANQTAAALEKVNARFLFASRSQERASREIAFVTSLSKRLGLNLLETAEAYSRLQAASAGTALEGEHTKNIFIGISEAVAALKLDGQSAEGMFRAIEQIMSKGSVAAEELRGQLGERLLGAFNLAARAMGVTTAELDRMLKAGEVTAEEFLPKFAKQLHEVSDGLAEQNVTSYSGAINGLMNAVTSFNKTFNQMFGISDKVIAAINGLTGVVRFLERNLRTIAVVAGGAAGALIGMAAPAIIRGVVFLATSLGNAAKAAALFNKALLANPAGALAKGFIVLGTAVAGMAAMDALLGDIDEAMADVNSEFQDLEDLTGTVTKLGKEFDTAKEKVFDLHKQIQVMRSNLEGVESGDLSLFRVDALDKARELLNGLNGAELTALEEHVRAIRGESFTTLLGSLADMFEILGGLTEEFTDLRDKIEATPEGMREFNQEMILLYDTVDALRKGPRALEQFERAQELARAIEQMRDRLEGLNLADDERNMMLERYEVALREVMILQDEFSTMSADWARAFTNGIEDAIFETNRLKDIVRELGKELVKIAIRSAFLEPFEKALSSAFGTAFSGARASGGPVQAGGTYLVGENGPEMVTFGKSGYVTPNRALGGITYNDYSVFHFTGQDGRSQTMALQTILAQHKREVMAEMRHEMHRRRM